MNVLERLVRRVHDAYPDDQGIACLWSNYRDGRGPSWEIGREFHPLLWGFGVELRRDMGGNWLFGHPHAVNLLLTVGPLSVCLRREWPA